VYAQEGDNKMILKRNSAAGKTKVSRPGAYSGYSEEIYPEVVRISRYLYIKGINIAADIYRPSKDGIKPVSEPWPAVIQHFAYHRRNTDINIINRLVKRGYVVLILDARGTGASFGYKPYQFSQEEAWDTHEIIEWAVAQPWCDGKAGMYGGSQMGGTQMLIASTRPPHLVSITPCVTSIDQFMRHPNGVLLVMPEIPGGAPERDVSPVDADPSGMMAAAAQKEHERNFGLSATYPGPYVFRNDFLPGMKNMPSIISSPITYADDIKASGVVMYNLAGWHDQASTSQFGAWKLWGGKLLMGPWIHGETIRAEMCYVEHLRWFDYTLKSIDNGIMDEPPICYYTFNAPEGRQWRSASEWPLPKQKLTKYYFGEGSTGTVGSVNDGSLSPSAPTGSDANDDYRVDYSVEVFDGKFKENARVWDGDMTAGTDSKGLTYTSPPLAEDMEVTGHPVAYLWASSTSRDGDFHAFLEEVDGETGRSHFVTNGMIRASNRKVSTQFPWTDMGIPYHRCYDVDAEPLKPGEAAELAFDFYPTSYIFRRGNRIRVTITGANAPIYAGIVEDPAPTISIYRDAARASYIELPVIPAVG
jgi:putative CocE/NonD family hydrolase